MKPNDFIKRYQKQITLPQIGDNGQLKLSKSHIAIIGVGGLGSIAAAYLAGAGIGKITLIDHDYPDVSNLHRQVFFNLDDGTSKVEQLKKHIKTLNKETEVIVQAKSVNKANIESIISDADVVLDGTDDLYAKYLINDACVLHHTALAYASIHQVEGYAFIYNPKSNSANLRDFFPEISEAVIPTCSDAGVYNILAGMFGLIQANEAIKHLLNLDGRLENKMLIYNALNYSQQFIKCRPSKGLHIESLWQKESYKKELDSKIKEIEAEQLTEFLEKDKSIEVISLLEEWEDENPLAKATRLALGDFNDWTYDFKETGKYLVYCQKGIQSKLICSKLNEKHPDSTFYTLKGGIQARKINELP